MINVGMLVDSEFDEEILIGLAGDTATLKNYNNYAFLVSALERKEIDYVIVKFDGSDSDAKSLNLVKDFCLEFCSLIDQPHDENVISYHCYKKSDYRQKKTRFSITGLLTLLFRYSLGHFLLAAIEFSLLLQAMLELISLFDGIEHVPLYLNILITIVSIFISILSVEIIGNRLKYNPFKGYWKYYIIPETGVDSGYASRVNVRLPRLAKIDYKQSKLRIEGWQAGRTHGVHFKSDICELVHGGFAETISRTGSLFYTFKGADPHKGGNKNISGMVQLDWEKEDDRNQIVEMNGWYVGKNSKIIGNIIYYRISEAEFNRLREYYTAQASMFQYDN